MTFDETVSVTYGPVAALDTTLLFIKMDISLCKRGTIDKVEI